MRRVRLVISIGVVIKHFINDSVKLKDSAFLTFRVKSRHILSCHEVFSEMFTWETNLWWGSWRDAHHSLRVINWTKYMEIVLINCHLATSSLGNSWTLVFAGWIIGQISKIGVGSFWRATALRWTSTVETPGWRLSRMLRERGSRNISTVFFESRASSTEWIHWLMMANSILSVISTGILLVVKRKSTAKSCCRVLII